MNKHEMLMVQMENRFYKRMFEAVRSQIDSFIKDVRSDGLDHAVRNLHGIIGSNKVAQAIKELWMITAVYFANKTEKDIIRSEKKGFGINDKWIKDIIDFLREYLLNKAVIPISETTKAQILSVLEKGQQEGWGIDKIINELDVSEITKNRARMIVRTELTRAMWYGQELAIRDSPVMTEEYWIATRDARTRHSHMLMDGVKIDTGQKFKVPVFKKVGKMEIQKGVDLMSGPGDPAASAENVINCRCTKAVRAKRDAEGNIIRKPVGFSITIKN